MVGDICGTDATSPDNPKASSKEIFQTDSTTTSFVFTLLGVLVTWWLFPLLFRIFNSTKRRYIPRAIAWSAARICQPGSLGYFSIRTGATHEERMRFYYNGLEQHGNDGKKTKWSSMLLWGVDILLALIPAIMAVGARSTCEFKNEPSAAVAMSLWFFPAVPTAIIGIWIIADAKVFRLSRSWSIFGCYLLLLAVGLCLFVPLYAGHGAKKIVALPVLAYISMSLPASCSRGLNSWLWAILTAVHTTMARVLAVAWYALSGEDENGLPLKLGNNKAFGAFYLIAGIVCAAFSLWCVLEKGGVADSRYKLEQSRKQRRDQLLVTSDNGGGVEFSSVPLDQHKAVV